MSLLGRLFERRNLADAQPWLVELLGRGSQTAAGVWVTPDSALRNTAVFSAVTQIAGDIASLPLILYRRLPGGGKERAFDHPLYPILHDLPNDEQTSMEWREMLQAHLLLRGNAYCETMWNRDGSVSQLIPRHPDRVRPYRRVSQDGVTAIWYEYRPITGPIRQIAPGEMLHLRGLSSDGLVGLSPIALMREAVGLGMAAEEFESRFFSNDATPGVVLKHPAVLKEEAAKRLKQNWQEMHSGLPNVGKVAVLEEGMSVEKLGMTNRDAEFLSLRKYQVEDVARIFRIPQHKIGALERSTNNNIEQQAREYVFGCLLPWAVRWEQVIARDLLSAKARNVYFVEFLFDAMLRADTATRFNAYTQAVGGPWMAANEARVLENLNPDPNLDEVLRPLNMIIAGQEPPVAKTAPKAPEPEEQPGDGELKADEELKRIRGALRAHVLERNQRWVRKKVARMRFLLAKYQGKELVDEIEKFFRESGIPHAKDALREIRAALPGGAPALNALIGRWEESRADELTKGEMQAWER
jgi:HK97 family phage portal protein